MKATLTRHVNDESNTTWSTLLSHSKMDMKVYIYEILEKLI